MATLDALTLPVGLSLPFLGVLVKKQLVDKSSTQFWRWEVERECLPHKSPSRWRPHTRLHSPWGIVFICMGLASWLVWRQGGFAAHPLPLTLYGALLVAVWLTWPATFIKGKRLSAAFDALVLLGTTVAVSVKFHDVDPLASLLLLPFLAYATYGTLLLSLSLDSLSTEVADQAQSLASVECFEPVHYPVPMHAAAAFATPREEIDTAQPAGAKSEPPAAADIARFQSPPIVRSAFADPAAQGVSGRVQQAHDILTGVSNYLEESKADGGVAPSTELMQSAIQQAQRLLTRVWDLVMSLLDRCPSPSPQVSSKLATGSAEAIRSGEVRALTIAQSISGALQRVSALRSPSSGEVPSGGGGQGGPSRTSGPLSPVREGGLGVAPAGVTSDSIPLDMFSCPGAAGFKVRGPNYLQDKKKVLPDAPVCSLVSLNLLSMAEPTFHIARFLPSIRDSKAPLHFIWHVLVPGKQNYSLAIAWAVDHDPVEAVKEVLARSAEEEEEEGDEGKEGPSARVAYQQRHGSVEVATHPAVLQMKRSASAADTQIERSSLDAEASGDSGASFATDVGAGPSHIVERSSKSLSALKLDGTPKARRGKHKRSQTVMDGSPPKVQQQQQPKQPPTSQPGTPLRHALWGSRAAAAAPEAEEPAGPNPYTACDPFDVTMMRFLQPCENEKEAEKQRHGVFKIIPRITEGSWVVKQAVGQNTPVLLGRKLTTKYFRGANYIEVDVDVGSSRSAANVVGLVQGALKSLVIDLAVLLEGHCTEELPERLLGTCRLEHLDLAAAAHLDTNTGVITRKA